MRPRPPPTPPVGGRFTNVDWYAKKGNREALVMLLTIAIIIAPFMLFLAWWNDQLQALWMATRTTIILGVSVYLNVWALVKVYCFLHARLRKLLIGQYAKDRPPE